jgi:predicted dehydrogenase
VCTRAKRNPKLASARQYTDYEKMLGGEELDVVAVCNTNGERARAILACANRKLNVIAEKPLAIERQDLDRIRETVARNKIGLSMLLPMRFSPPYLALKQVVDSGEIGEVAQMGAQKSYKLGDRPAWMRKRESYGGTIPYIGIHMVDLMRWGSGREFTEVFSYQTRIGFPELGDMENVTGSLFRLDNGGIAVLRMDYLRPETAPTHGDDRLRIVGTKGVVEYQLATGVTVLSDRRKPEVIEKLPAGGSVFVDFLESVYNGKSPRLPLADIYRVNEIVLVARQAGEQHRPLPIL